MRKCKEKYEVKPFVLFCFINHGAIEMTIVVSSIVFNGIKMQLFQPVIDPSTLARLAVWARITYTSCIQYIISSPEPKAHR